MDSLLLKSTNGNIYIEDSVIQDSDIPQSASYSVNCEDSLILPGLIDFHVHVFRSGSEFSVPADISLIPQGITTAVDGGSSGSANYNSFLKSDVLPSIVRILPLINVSLFGQPTLKFGERLETRFLNASDVKRVFDTALIPPVAIKLRMGKESAEGLGIQPLIDTINIAEETGVKVVVHASDPEVSAEEIADHLRPGDVFCHCYHEKGPCIVDAAGRISRTIWDAKERGVLFDAANGKSNFSFRVAQTAFGEGFFPDIISTDLTTLTVYKDYSFGLPYLMSKYLALGLPLADVIRAVTETPAKWLGLNDQIGSLKPGSKGDIAVMDLVDRDIVFSDVYGRSIKGTKLFVPRMTVKDGVIVYRQADYAL